MKSRAAVAFKAGEPLQIVEIDVAPPQKGEVLVRITHTGVCQTDAFTLDASFRRPVELPSEILVRAWTGVDADPARSGGRQHRVRVSAPDSGKTCIHIVLSESAMTH